MDSMLSISTPLCPIAASVSASCFHAISSCSSVSMSAVTGCVTSEYLK